MRQLAHTQGIVSRLAVITVLTLWLACPVQAQEAEWKRLNQEVNSLYSQGNYGQAVIIARQALGVAEKIFGPEHRNVAISLNNLAWLYRTQGQYAQAESLFRRLLVILEKALGPEHPDVAETLNNLAALYAAQGQYAQAEPLYKRSLAIREKALGPEHLDVAQSLNNLAVLYNTQRQHAKAEPLYRRSLAIIEKARGPEHPSVAASLNNLGAFYQAQDHYAQAEPLLRRSLAILEKARGPEHPDVAETLNNLAELYQAQGQYAQAEPLYKRSLAIREKALGPDHPLVATSLKNLASSYIVQGKFSPSLAMLRRASAIYRQRIVAGGVGDDVVREAAQNRDGFILHLSLLTKNPNGEAADKISDEAFQILQLKQASGTASAIAKMASRFASGDDALAGLVKRKQDATEQRAKGEAQLVSAASQPPQARKTADEQRLRDNIARAGNEVEMIDAELTRRFPGYQELTRTEPLSIQQVQALLHPEEALLAYVLDDKVGLYFLLVVRPDATLFLSPKSDVKAVAAKVATIRSEMEFNNVGRAARVSVGTLHELYKQFFVPALPQLAGVTHVMVVPSGPLQSLPFSMLVASPPPQIKSDADYRQVDWLAKHYALSVLPSVGSIQALRQFAKAGSAQEPFAGFGDPLIGETGGTTRGKRTKLDIAKVFRNLVVQANAKTPTPAHVTEIADVEAIRNAPRLPETADELRAMAKVLKSDPKSLWLRENATETTIKRLDLSKYRTLAFATHGVMAGEVKGIGESGLILTPPREGSLEDDGYLSASEIAKLKLNADWVLLSACNTAAADGTPGAEGLSGLAKAFFYAGSRSLLVSHWPVASEATVPLTTAMLKEYAAHPARSKAEAHRKAMLALIATPDRPEYAHPLFWAPFVVVGEGGVGSQAKNGQR